MKIITLLYFSHKYKIKYIQICVIISSYLQFLYNYIRKGVIIKYLYKSTYKYISIRI